MTWLALKALFGRIPISTWLMGAGVAAALGYHLYARHEAYEAGKRDVTAKIEEANREADKKADAGEDDVARCYRTGGRWVRTSGSCEQTVRGHR